MSNKFSIIKLRSLIITAVAITTLYLGAAPVFAQQKFVGLILRTPAAYNGFTFEYFMKPGEQRCDKFTAQHDFQETNKAYTFYSMVSDFDIDPQTQQPIFPKDRLVLEKKFSLASWIRVDQDSVTLPSWGMEKDVNFCINVPGGAEPGTHYAVILLSNITKAQYLAGNTPIDENGAALGTRTGVNILVTVAGEVNKNLDIGGMRVVDIDNNGALFNLFEYQPLNVVVDLVNDGNQFVKPAGNLSIHGGDLASPILFAPFNPDGNRILPQTKASLSTPWNDGPLYIVKDTSKSTDESGNEVSAYSYRLAFDLSKVGSLRFGHYYATLQMLYYDTNGKLQRAPDYTVDFWIIPWKLILVVLLIIIAVILYIRRNHGTGVKYISKKSMKWKSAQKK